MNTPAASARDQSAPLRDAHGKTRAAWVANGGVVLGATITAVGVGGPVYPLVWAGSGVIVAALVAGQVLKVLGHGQPPR